ncbi:endonuclease/exonuclease/phosphatase family protein [Catenuloplanes indicus]|uniref:Endonuclease/exonuclease/phosphatase family metal-dependent hydrolase n=1 Tax=Catenuloplanes indicus TaxID=137267 RepID=A0AAE3W4L9_9ACTN|nr:endonuclease/exonuclease/phosphatase family protein [Catenuloplanes indicus]MDQ0369369.1 endonuclease/exonuclease/phosphatase family metal-dependent hydrolase [Catenuloplanes indicus]
MRRLASLLAAVLIAVLAPATAASAAPKNLQVMSWNMCGSLNWGCDAYGGPQDKIDVVKYHVETNYVHAALLQEVCENDLTLLMNQLGSGWSKSFAPYQHSTDGVRRTSVCGGTRTDRIGTAIVVKAGMSSPQNYEITHAWNGLARPFHCVTATYWDTRLCNVHLDPAKNNPDQPDWEYADDQMKDIQTIVAAFPTLVVGGDFNVQPQDRPGNARKWLWADGFWATDAGTPGYRECDQTGAVRDGRDTWTGNNQSGKLDYVFSTETKRWCAVGDSAYSDHHVVIYSVSVD